MKFSINYWWILPFYPLAIFFIIYLAKDFYTSKRKKYTIITTRCLILLLLFLSLSNVSIVKETDKVTTIFLADLSDSMTHNSTEVEEFINKAISSKNDKDYKSTITFGEDALVDLNVTQSNNIKILGSRPSGMYTNIEQGINRGLSTFPKDHNKRLVILTDGKETKGDLTKLLPILSREQIEVKTVLFEDEYSDDVAIDKITTPKSLNSGAPFQINISIKSTVDTSGKLTLIGDDKEQLSENISITKGNNNFIFNGTASNSGFVTYKVMIEPLIDSIKTNNEASAFIKIKDKNKVLIVKDKENEADEIEKILNSGGLDFDTVFSNSVPISLKGLSKYKSIILCNVSAENLDHGFMNNIESYVKDLGGGLLAIGGKESFALGGYYKTSLEKVLPVYMDMRGKREIPSMAMTLVIDRSGSMSGQKLALAKAGANQTIETLRDVDEIGVLSFDSNPKWEVELQKATDKDSLRKKVNGIGEGGGTSILPALSEAVNAMEKSTSKIKHIILLTDGQAETSGYDTLLQTMKDLSITISTVAIGDGADTHLLEYIANEGNGRYYFSKSSTNVPRIFSKETFMATRTYINNDPFTPLISSAHPILTPIIDVGLPPMLGYIGTSEKNTSTVLLKSPEDDPILAIWRYGLGKTAAFTSDLTGNWSANYVNFDKTDPLFLNIVNWTLENISSDEIEVEARTNGDNINITLMERDNSILHTYAEAISPSNENIKINLEQTEKNIYTGSFTPKEKGIYLIKGIQEDESAIKRASITGVVIPYSSEYKIDQDNDKYISFISTIGAKVINNPNMVFNKIENKISSTKDITIPLLVIALMLFILDIAFRRLNILK